MGYSIPKQNAISYGPEALRSFHGYIFEWIDNLHFTQAPSAFVGSQAAAYIAAVKDRFLAMGWEGDGDIELLWLPPFVFRFDAGIKPEGLVLWHVKQEEDGVSFLLSPVQLPFEAFRHDGGGAFGDQSSDGTD
ncbi:hypothetical protein [Lysobacter sp. Root604]|uniref:hypothetical protein n=1 Tax=Lysobacter sp. Root604 TaxID=1736568 RepID=UPI000A9A0223|nr:hypothetical protein [Lysobacter sp. Root604]